MAKRRAGRRGIGVVLLLTVTAIGGMLFYDAVRQAAVPTVETIVLSRQTVSESVICAGTVTAGEDTQVYVSVPCVAGEIAVEVGDRVEKGDVLLTVDRAATLAMAVGAGLSEEQSVMASTALPQVVTAPAEGVVSAVGAVSGAMLTTESPCVVLSEGDGVAIAVEIRESLLPRVTVGQTVAVSGVAFDKEVYKGTVTEIASTARTRLSGTSGETVVDAVVTLDEGEADDSLLLGLSAKASITVATQENVLLIPYECLTQDDSGVLYVYCVRGNTAQKVAVSAVKELPQGIVAQSALSEGDSLAVSPSMLDGERITVKTEGTV